MAKPRKNRKKEKTARRRFPWLVLFLLAAGVVFWGRGDLLWGLKGYLLDEIDYLRINSESDLPPSAEAHVRPAEVVGIPDYKNAPRFPNSGKTLTCYRMVGFGNRLCVCTERGLASPKAIGEIIKERTIRGRLEILTKSQINDSLRRIFLKTGSIRLAEDVFLLYEDPTPLPSKVKLGFFAFCAVLCCFSAYRLIK
jgi:hypothetical protein